MSELPTSYEIDPAKVARILELSDQLADEDRALARVHARTNWFTKLLDRSFGAKLPTETVIPCSAIAPERMFIDANNIEKRQNGQHPVGQKALWGATAKYFTEVADQPLVFDLSRYYPVRRTSQNLGMCIIDRVNPHFLAYVKVDHGVEGHIDPEPEVVEIFSYNDSGFFDHFADPEPPLVLPNITNPYDRLAEFLLTVE